VKQGAVTQTALVKLALPSLFNDVLCKQFPREFALLTRKLGPSGNDGLPSAIECGNQGANGVRSKYAGVYMILKELAQLPLRDGARSYFTVLLNCVHYPSTAARDGQKETTMTALAADLKQWRAQSWTRH
jgi:hypothetical protein